MKKRKPNIEKKTSKNKEQNLADFKSAKYSKWNRDKSTRFADGIVEMFPSFFRAEICEIAIQRGLFSRHAFEKVKRDITLFAKSKYLNETPDLLMIQKTVLEYLELMEDAPILNFDINTSTVYFAEKRLKIRGKLQAWTFEVLYSAWRKNSFAHFDLFEHDDDLFESRYDYEAAIRQRIKNLRRHFEKGGMRELAAAIQNNNKRYGICFEGEDSIRTIINMLILDCCAPLILHDPDSNDFDEGPLTPRFSTLKHKLGLDHQ